MINILRYVLFASAALLASVSPAQPVEPVLGLAKKETSAYLNTLRSLVETESGSSDREGLDKIAETIAARLRALGARTEFIEPGADMVRFSNTPDKTGKTLRATFTGKGAKKILLLAHMDTVYPRGSLAKQPFKVDGDKVWGLGIADDKQGVALVIHTLTLLKALNFNDYGTITVLINGDEEINSPGSRHLITRMGSEHDAVMSFEGGGNPQVDQVRLATSGIAQAMLKVKGRASHAGGAPEQGVNALYELAHQIMQMRDLSDPKIGLKVNWTTANAGVVRNMIPPEAIAYADIRVDNMSDLDAIEQRLRERIQKKLLPESVVGLDFERTFPPLESKPASAALAQHAKRIYGELGKDLTVRETPTGGGTDAANASLKTKAPVVEGFGLRGFGAHSTNAEYILIESIEPRMYLATRMIMDIGQGKAPLTGE